MEKLDAYKELVLKRQSLNNLPQGLSNYAETGYEIDHIDAWELWHSNLDAEIMVVGQDFSDDKTFIRDRGGVEPINQKYKYATNENLAMLFEKGLDIQTGHPLEPNLNAKLFFTNAIVGLKKVGGMQGKVDPQWATYSAKEFIRPLIEIIEPKAVITLGNIAFRSIASAFREELTSNINLSKPFRDQVGQSFHLSPSTTLFPVYHCGQRSVNINRCLDKQVEDWRKIGESTVNNIRKK